MEQLVKKSKVDLNKLEMTYSQVTNDIRETMGSWFFCFPHIQSDMKVTQSEKKPSLMPFP